jgi:hypothetical protein
LATNPVARVVNPCDVPARPAQTRDEAASHGIGNERRDNGDGGGRSLGGEGSGRGGGHNDIHLAPHQLRRQGGELIFPVGRPAVVDGKVLSLYPTELA